MKNRIIKGKDISEAIQIPLNTIENIAALFEKFIEVSEILKPEITKRLQPVVSKKKAVVLDAKKIA